MKKINLIFFLSFYFAVGGAVNDAQKTQNEVFSASKNRKDQELFQRNDFNALEKIINAPYAVALIAQIVLVAAQYNNDFALQCPRSGCKHMEYPDSFKASLLQMSFSAYNSFNKAHVNMDEIEMLTRLIPIEVRSAVRTLILGSDLEIKLLLPVKFNSIKESTKSAVLLATETVNHFNTTSNILNEIILGGTTTQTMSAQAVKELKRKIESEEKLKEEYTKRKQELEKNKIEIKKMLQKSNAELDKALKDLPDGWEIIDMNLSEALAGSLAKFVDGLARVFKGESMPQNTGDGRANTEEEKSKAFRKHLELPKCNIEGKNNKNDEQEDKDNTVKMNGKEAKSAAMEYAEALFDLNRVESLLEEFSVNIFVFNDTEAVRIKTDGEKQVVSLKKATSEPKKLIDTSMHIPKETKKELVLFYKNMYDLADKIKSNLSKNLTKENLAELQKEVEDVLDSSKCFNNWAKEAIQIPAMDPPVPFSTQNSDPTNAKRASQIATENAQLKVKIYQNQLENKQKENEVNTDRLVIASNKLMESINLLREFNGTKATLDEIISILQDALKTLQELRVEWLKILDFFQEMELKVDISMGLFNGAVNEIETGSTLKQKEGLSEHFKQDMYKKVQMAMTSSYLVNRMSSVYVNISKVYIMPPVRSLGIMMETKDPKEITKLKEEIKDQSEDANREIKRKIEEEKIAFDLAVEKRIEEIEVQFKPVFDQIPQERKEKLNTISKKTKNAISKEDLALFM